MKEGGRKGGWERGRKRKEEQRITSISPHKETVVNIQNVDREITTPPRLTGRDTTKKRSTRY